MGDVNVAAVPAEASTTNAVSPLAVASWQRVGVNMRYFPTSAAVSEQFLTKRQINCRYIRSAGRADRGRTSCFSRIAVR
jgi:hypothetical protein